MIGSEEKQAKLFLVELQTAREGNFRYLYVDVDAESARRRAVDDFAGLSMYSKAAEVLEVEGYKIILEKI